MTLETPSKIFYREFEPAEEDLLILKEWIAKMPHILQDYDDYFLRAFIRCKKGSIQNTKILLEKFNSLGYRFPKSMGHLDPFNQTFQDFLKANFAFPLPKRTEDGSLICLLSGRNDPNLDLSNYSWHEALRHQLMTIFAVFWERLEGNGKMILVWDCSNENLARLKNVTPGFLRDILLMLEASPARMQGVHLIKVPTVFEPFLNIAKSFMKTKLLQRLHLHRTIDSLWEKFPRELLPEELGGCEASMNTLHDSWTKKLESYRDDLIKTSNKMRKLDALRPKLKYDQELEGTFRQLRID